MKANDITLSGILNTGNQYTIPVFQRFYVWGKDEWQKLWDDVLEVYEDTNTRRKHFMGAIVVLYGDYTSNNGIHTFQVIDGQQRTITMSLLLCTLRNIALKYKLNGMVTEIEGYYLFHNPNTENELLRVYPRQRDRDIFIAAMKQRGSRTFGNNKIDQALEFFTSNIEDLITQPEEASDILQRLLSLLKMQLEFVWVELKGENPYRIFKSLNSTGVELEEGDLIRNFVFMHIPVDEQDSFDDKHWMQLERDFLDDRGKLLGKLFSAFFRDFLMRHGRYVTLNSIFSTFEETYEDDLDPVALTDELVHIANFYNYLRGVTIYEDQEINTVLIKIRGLDTSTVYPLLLCLMEKLESNAITKTDFIESTELLSSFIMRRYITGENSRQYGRWFVAAAREVYENNDVLSKLKSFLISKGFPNNETFKNALLRFSIYGRNYTRYVLEMLEYSHPHKERADMTNASIEHIMPQNLTTEWKTHLGGNWKDIHEQWQNTIGNLTLSAYNPELSNKPFDYKRSQFYENSNIILTRKLANYTQWQEEQIIDRGKKLAAIACEIWKPI